MTKLEKIYRTGYIHLTAYESEFRHRINTLEALMEQNKFELVCEVIQQIRTSLGYMADDIKETDDKVLENM